MYTYYSAHVYIIIYRYAQQWQLQFKTYEQNGLAFEFQ